MYSAQMFRDKRKDVINLFIATEDGKRIDVWYDPRLFPIISPYRFIADYFTWRLFI